MKSTTALFLDRDGVINIDIGYLHKPEDCVFVDGIFDLVKRANVLGYKVFVVTNQAGIARGYYTETQFLEFSAWMKAEFIRHEAHIEQIYFCPHHPVYGVGEYHIECDCRKPAPGMFLKAQSEFNIDMLSSVMVGDNVSDLQAAQTAKVGHLNLFIDNKIERSITESELSQAKNLLISTISILQDVKLTGI